jgi:CheY-like chemotaxis protein
MRRRTVLVVEDDDDLRKSFAIALSLDGFAVLEARSGFEALRLLQTRASPDMVLLDLGLPGVGGHDVLADVRAHASTQHIPVVVVTGFDGEFNDLDVECVLRKPVTTATLIETVRRCLSDAEETG